MLLTSVCIYDKVAAGTVAAAVANLMLVRKSLAVELFELCELLDHDSASLCKQYGKIY
jgi:hypothetical protein